MSNNGRAAEVATVSDAVETALKYVRAAGVQGAVAASVDDGTSVGCRMQTLETLEFHRSQQLSVTVFDQSCKGSASTAELSDAAIKETVDAALRIAKYTSEDECAGLADAALMATDIKDMQLFHPYELNAEEAIATVLECEKAALDHAPEIKNSEGANINAFAGTGAYGNTHGFMQATSGTSYSLSCSVIAEDRQGMQRDYWYSSDRDIARLEAAKVVGVSAASRAVRRLSPRKLTTRQAPVIFSADIAKSLIGHLCSALAGTAIYRDASFLLDQVGEKILPENISIHEDPHLVRGHKSASYDREGVATKKSYIVEDGKISRYLLSSYAARRLGLETTANAGGTRNIRITHGEKTLDELMREMGTGLLATELIGQGVNNVTGDYSRGVAGFWVENGELAYPVEELTIAGNLRDMFEGLIEIGVDTDTRGNVHSGSWLLDDLTIAGA